MTLHGWDASHYDGPLTKAILARARAEGIAFFHHKVAEGLSDTEGTMDDTALAAARDAGIEFIGAYLVPRTLDSAAQVAEWVALLRAGEPWLFTWPGRYAVVDLERWSYDNVSAGKGIDCALRLRAVLGWRVFLYASHGQYGDSLTAWDGPLINADYVSAPAGGIAQMYPGDDWQPLHGTWRGGWAPYSGKTPAMLQYTSSATIAGLTTCDADAFRGTVDQLRALITGTKPQEEDTVITLVRTKDSPLVWRCEGGLRTPIPSEQHLADIVYQAGQGNIAPLANDGEVMVVDNPDAFGIAYPPPAPTVQPAPAVQVTMTDADRQAIIDGVAAKLAPLIPTPAQVVDEEAKRLGNG